MRIGLDLDGVLVDSIPTWIAVLNREAGRSYQLGQLPATHATPELAAICDRREVEMLILPGPVPGAAAALAELRAAGHELVVITARGERVRRLTEAWLDYHGMAVDRLHFLEGGSKGDTALAEGIDFLVEDTPHQALAVAEAGIPVLLYSEPYNRHLGHALIRHCQGWSEVLSAIAKGARSTGLASPRFGS